MTNLRMRVLSKPMLSNAIIMCEHNPWFKVGILVSTAREQYEVRDYLTAFHYDRVPWKLGAQVYFANCSTIHTFVATNESVRGRRFHLILYDDRVDMDEYGDMLRHCLLPDYDRRQYEKIWRVCVDLFG